MVHDIHSIKKSLIYSLTLGIGCETQVITKNWRGKPLVSFEVVVNLIANTRTEKGLTVKCELDRGIYEKGITVTDEELSKINIKRDEFHGERNYTISPVING